MINVKYQLNLYNRSDNRNWQCALEWIILSFVFTSFFLRCRCNIFCCGPLVADDGQPLQVEMESRSVFLTVGTTEFDQLIKSTASSDVREVSVIITLLYTVNLLLDVAVGSCFIMFRLCAQHSKPARHLLGWRALCCFPTFLLMSPRTYAFFLSFFLLLGLVRTPVCCEFPV